MSTKRKHRRTVPWPPHPEKREERSDHYVMRDGEPLGIELTRWAGDSDPRGHQFEICCDCGLTHLITYQLEAVGKKGFFLRKRYYRIDKKRRK